MDPLCFLMKIHSVTELTLCSVSNNLWKLTILCQKDCIHLSDRSWQAAKHRVFYCICDTFFWSAKEQIIPSDDCLVSVTSHEPNENVLTCFKTNILVCKRNESGKKFPRKNEKLTPQFSEYIAVLMTYLNAVGSDSIKDCTEAN